MKVIFFIILITIGVVKSYGQTVFGTDINTTSKKFELSMSKKGYKPTERVSGHAVYDVTYAGYKGAKMKVYIDESNDSIASVSLYFDNRPMQERSDIFNNLEKQFKAKYLDGKSFRHDIELINTHQRWWNSKEGHVSMMFDEVNGKFFIEYNAIHSIKDGNVKPSSDI